MSGVADNPDVPLAVWTPDTYIYIDTAPQNAVTGPEPARMYIVEPMLTSSSALCSAPYSLTAGTGTPNEIKQWTSVTKVEQAFGRRSGAATRFREAIAMRPFGNEIYIVPVKEAGSSGFTGCASAMINVVGTISGGVQATAASGSGEVLLWLCGHLVKFTVANGDTLATIAAAMLQAIKDQAPYAPLVPHPSLLSSPTTAVGLAYIHRGEIGNDRPIMVRIPPGLTGFRLSPGYVVVAGTAGTGDKLFTMLVGSSSTGGITVTDTNTAVQTAAQITAGINALSAAGTFPLAAQQRLNPDDDKVDLFFNNDWVVHRIQVSSTQSATKQTFALYDRHDHGNPTAAASSVTTTAGSTALTALAGSGTPTLTTALANAEKLTGALEWVTEFTDATSVGAIRQHFATWNNGLNQRNQRLTLCSSEDIDTARTRVTGSLAPSPDLTNYWEYTFGIAQDIPVQAATYATMLAAELCARTLPYNLDGLELKSGLSNVPLLPARADVELSPSERDVAMRSYHMTPFRGVNGKVVMVRGVTTWGGTNIEWCDLSYGRVYHDDRYRLRQLLNRRLAGKVFFQYTTPRIANAFELSDVDDIIIEHLQQRDGITQDGAADLAQYVKTEVDPNDGSRLRSQYRARPPREKHVGTVVVTS